jgi:hypothetical protein
LRFLWRKLANRGGCWPTISKKSLHLAKGRFANSKLILTGSWCKATPLDGCSSPWRWMHSFCQSGDHSGRMAASCVYGLFQPPSSTFWHLANLEALLLGS